MENISSKINTPTVYLNNAHLIQIEKDNIAELPTHLKGCGYEHTFQVSSLKQLKELLANKELRIDLRKRMQKFAFVRTTCIFQLCSRFAIPLEIQRNMVDYQHNLFNDITITHVENQPADILPMIEYASKKNEDIAIFTDFHHSNTRLEEVYNVVKDNDKVKIVKIYSLRFVGNEDKYRRVKNTFDKSSKRLHLTHCQRTIRIGDVEGLSFEHLAMLFGFASFTQNYLSGERKQVKRGGFVPTPFNRTTLLYEVGKSAAYRQQKLIDLGNVAEELLILQQAVRSGTLAEYSRTKTSFHKVLVQVSIINKRT